jgi:hypothetical protein
LKVHLAVHIGPTVLRFVAIDPNGEDICQRAIANTPGAAYTMLPGSLPTPGAGVEAAAAQFKEDYLGKAADKFLADHGYTDSGVYPRLKVVS